MRRFLSGYTKFGTITVGCHAAGIDPATYYRWVSDDEAFAADVDTAKLRVRDKLEGEAHRRAIGGRSDRMLIFLMQGHDPDRYRETRQVTNNTDVSLTLNNIGNDSIKRLTSEEIASMRRIIRKIHGLPV